MPENILLVYVTVCQYIARLRIEGTMDSLNAVSVSLLQHLEGQDHASLCHWTVKTV